MNKMLSSLPLIITFLATRVQYSNVNRWLASSTACSGSSVADNQVKISSYSSVLQVFLNTS